MKLENWHTEKVKFQRCSAAQKLKSEGVDQHSNDDSWFVQSSTKSDVSYTVTHALFSCNSQLKCHSYGACVHMNTCSCVDYDVHFTVCKHAHKLMMVWVLRVLLAN